MTQAANGAIEMQDLTGKTPEEIRAIIAEASKAAMNDFERDLGTRDVGKVVGALRKTIPGSASPADAARKARASLA